MNSDDLTPFRISKPFAERMHEVLDAISSDPNGLYQVTYRVGQVMVSAQIWVDSSDEPPNPELTDFDREFLKQVRVLPIDQSEEHAAH